MLEESEVAQVENDANEDLVVNGEMKTFASYIDNILEDESLAKNALGVKVAGLFRDEDFLGQCQAFAEYATENDDIDQEIMSCVDWEIQSVTFGELISGSQYQQQHGLSASAIAQLFLDKTTGLVSNAFLYFFPVEAIETPDGYILIGGHTRLASKALILRSGGLTWERVFNQEINCQVGSISAEKLAFAFETSEKDARDKLVPKIEATLWLASNKSRKPTTDESSSFSDAKNGVNLFDPESVLDSTVLSAKDKCVTLFLSRAYTDKFIPDRKTGSVEKQWTMNDNYPVSDPRRYWVKPSSNAVRAIFKSAVTQLSRINVADGKVKKWLPSLNNPTRFKKLVDSVFENTDDTGLTLIENAIIAALQQSDEEYSSNVGRNQAAIGRELANLIDAEYEPLIQPQVKKGKEKTVMTKKAVHFKTRRLS